MILANRLQHLGSSVFAHMTALAKKHQAVNLGQGFPNFPGPPKLLEAIAHQVKTCHNQYAPMGGEPALCEALCSWIHERLGLTEHPADTVTITTGASEALFCAINALLEPGDRVIVFEPAFDIYLQAIANTGATVVPVRLHAPDSDYAKSQNETSWCINWDEFYEACQGGFKLLIVNSPHNPTGKMFTAEEGARIAEVVLKRKAILITDEVYENLVYDGQTHFSFAQIPELKPHTIRISSAAKTFGFTGLKVGWACASPELTQAIRLVHQATVFCVNPSTQLGLADVINEKVWLQNYLDEQKHLYQKKRDFLTVALEQADFKVSPCPGSFFLMGGYGHQKENGHLPSMQYTLHLIEQKRVACIPMETFYVGDAQDIQWVRFAFCKTDETLQEAGQRLKNSL